MRQWLARPPKNATAVSVCTTDAEGNALATVAEYSAQEVADGFDVDKPEARLVSDAIRETCQDYTNGERKPQRFTLRWHRGADIAKEVPHRVQPTRAALEDVQETPQDAYSALLAMNRALLDANAQKDRQINNTLGTIQVAYDRTIKALLQELERRANIPEPTVEVVEPSEEEKEESRMRSRALGLLVDRFPDLLQLGLAFVEARSAQKAESAQAKATRKLRSVPDGSEGAD